MTAENRLVWTDALLAGWRPAPKPGFFTATITIEAHGSGSRSVAVVRHGDERSCQKHQELGCHEGWSAALAQLIDLAKTW